MLGTRTRRALSSLSVGLVVVAMLAVGAMPAPAASLPAATPSSGTVLPLAHFYAMAVDAAHGHVFVSGGPGTSSIVVLDLSGNVVTAIPNQSGASGMALVGSTLYVALADAGAIGTIDAASLTAVRTQSTNPSVKPLNLVFAGGKLWFNMNTGVSTGGLASLDPASGVVATFNRSVTSAVLATSPTDPNLVLAADSGVSPPTFYRFDVSSGSPTQVTSRFFLNNGSTSDISIGADGSKFYAAGGVPPEIDEYRTSDLMPTGLVYPDGPFPVAVDGGPLGNGKLAVGIGSIGGDDTFVFHLGVTAPLANVPSGGIVQERGVRFAPGGNSIFVISSDQVVGGTPVFHVLPATGVPAPPTGVSATAGDRSATVSFTPAPANGITPTFAYLITASTGQHAIVGAAATSGTVEGLTDGVPVTFTVRGGNAAGLGPPSASSAPVTPFTDKVAVLVGSTPSYSNSGFITGGDARIVRSGDAITQLAGFVSLPATNGTALVAFVLAPDGQQWSGAVAIADPGADFVHRYAVTGNAAPLDAQQVFVALQARDAAVPSSPTVPIAMLVSDLR